jgi:uncharacterized protein YabE (DUF348 family)
MKIQKAATSNATLIILGVILANLIVAVTLRALPTLAEESPSSSEIATTHFITIYDEGTKTTIKSDVATVSAALEKAQIAVTDSDLIDPAPNTEILSQNFTITIHRARPALVVDGTRRLKVMTAATSPREVVSSAKIVLYEADVVKITTSNFLETGVPIEHHVIRATPVNFSFYGKPTLVRTQATTVRDFLSEQNITLTDADWLSLPLETKITADLNLQLYREGKNIITLDEPIAFTEQIIYDYDRDASYRQIQTPGVSGQKTATYEITLEKGVEVSRTLISEIILAHPVAQVTVVGAKSSITTTPTENERISWDYFRAQGFSLAGTAGLMGNLMQEHGFQTSGTKNGLGLAQWTGGRRTNLEQIPNYLDIYVQLDYLMSELNRYSELKTLLSTTDSIYDAVVTFQSVFERCRLCSRVDASGKLIPEGRRLPYAEAIFDRYAH